MSPTIRKRITAPETDPKNTAEKIDNGIKNSSIKTENVEEKIMSKKDSSNTAIIKNIETNSGGKVKIIKKERKRITAPEPEKPAPSIIPGRIITLPNFKVCAQLNALEKCFQIWHTMST